MCIYGRRKAKKALARTLQKSFAHKRARALDGMCATAELCGGSNMLMKSRVHIVHIYKFNNTNVCISHYSHYIWLCSCSVVVRHRTNIVPEIKARANLLVFRTSRSTSCIYIYYFTIIDKSNVLPVFCETLVIQQQRRRTKASIPPPSAYRIVREECFVCCTSSSSVDHTCSKCGFVGT